MKTVILLALTASIIIVIVVYLFIWNNNVESELKIIEKSQTKKDTFPPLKEFIENPNSTIHSTNSKKNGSKIVNTFIEKIETFFKKNSDINIIDKEMIDFLKSEKFSRNEKIETLWYLLAKEDLSYLEFRFYAESLGTLNSTLLASKIIELYDGRNKEKKIILLELLREIISIKRDLREESPETLEKILIEQKAGQDFINNTLYAETDIDLFDASFKTYSSFTSANKLLSKIDELFTTERETNISRSYLTNSLLQKIFTEEEESVQDSLLPQILAESYTKSEEFDDNLSFWINESETNKLSQQTITLLQERTLKSLQRFDTKVFSDDALEISKFNNNLEAAITLSLGNNTNKSDTIVDYTVNKFIYDNPSPSKVAYVITLSDSATTNSFKERKNDIIPSLKDGLQNQEISNEDKNLIQDVINILNGKG